MSCQHSSSISTVVIQELPGLFLGWENFQPFIPLPVGSSKIWLIFHTQDFVPDSPSSLCLELYIFH